MMLVKRCTITGKNELTIGARKFVDTRISSGVDGLKFNSAKISTFTVEIIAVRPIYLTGCQSIF